ncbi:MAG: DUF975 family protein, partial [Oscillospiraceae bacterium]|nr:DUF975 family protein [Oscillospiraceae bacterium]
MKKTNRSLLKIAARESMGTAQPSAKMVTLVYILLTTLLVSVIENAMAAPFNQLAELLASGYDPEWVMYIMLNNISWPLIAFVSILLALYSSVMSYGYTAYTLRLSRREEAGYNNLTEGFAMVGKVLITHILVGVFSFLWALLLMIPFSILVALIAAFASTGVAVGLIIILYVALLVGVLYFILRYVLTDCALFDDPEAGSLAAIRRSKELMQGRKLEYVVLALSFLGWAILVGLLSAIGGAIGGGIGGALGGGTARTVLSTVLSVVVS